MHKPNRYLTFCAALVAIALSACAQAPVSQTLPTVVAPNAAATPPGLKFRTFTAGVSPGLPSNAGPYDITLGPDGAMWFTDAGVPAIGRITTSGKITEFSKGLGSSAAPYAIVAGYDGNLWFSDGAGAIGRVTTAGAITEFAVKSSVLAPGGLVADPDGSIWSLAVGPPDALIHIAENGSMERIPTPKGLAPDGSLGIDAQGNLWMLAGSKESGLLLERKRDGGFETYPTTLVSSANICCPNQAPRRMATGAHGDIWFTALYWLSTKDPSGRVVGKTDSSGKTKLYPIDSKAVPYPALVSGIASVGTNVWFSGDDPLQVNGALFEIDAKGNQTVYPVPYNPASLAGDANGNLWFAGEGFDHPGQIIEAILPKNVR